MRIYGQWQRPAYIMDKQNVSLQDKAGDPERQGAR